MGGRRFANQVHEQVSRLLRGGFLQREPVWYKAVLQYPPLALPPRSPLPRTEYDGKDPKSKVVPGQPLKMRKLKAIPLPIKYAEDDLRRQFFRDHPFEAFRPITLVQGAGIEPPHAVTGEIWTRLRQRGRNPSPEDAVKFALNLHQHHGLTLSEAYFRAITQFRALRSEHHIATTYAVYEAEMFGNVFKKSHIEEMFEKEKKALKVWQQEKKQDEGELAAKKRWKAIIEKNVEESEWTKGQEYVRLWKRNIKAEYAPELTQPIAESTEPALKES